MHMHDARIVHCLGALSTHARAVLDSCQASLSLHSDARRDDICSSHLFGSVTVPPAPPRQRQVSVVAREVAVGAVPCTPNMTMNPKAESTCARFRCPAYRKVAADERVCPASADCALWRATLGVVALSCTEPPLPMRAVAYSAGPSERARLRP